MEENGAMDAEQYAAWPYFRVRFDSMPRSLRFRGTAGDVAAWQDAARTKLRSLIGLDTMRPCPLDAKVTARVDCGDHIRERIELRTEPMITMPAYVLIPKDGKGPFPTMLAPHGHGFGGKEGTAGVEDDDRVRQSIRECQCDYGRQLVRAGFVVLCPDARGFGERRELGARHDPMACSCFQLNNMAIPLGQTAVGMFVWDLMRLIDYAQTRPDCDTRRLGCAGLSGGGMQTLWLAALDKRVKAALSSGYFYGVKESLLDLNGNCSCNYVPHLWEHADQGDLGGLIAPRPFMVQTGTRDGLNGAGGLENVRSQMAIARVPYDLLGASGNLLHDVFDGEHRWDGTHSIDFFSERLG